MSELTQNERLFYRDKLREARYLALENSESFAQICFAIELLGARLNGKKETLARYYLPIKNWTERSDCIFKFHKNCFFLFSDFGTLFEKLRNARNDAMHTGAYARNATLYAIELCLMLEDSLMNNKANELPKLKKVADYMVKSPIFASDWHPLAYARQLMLMHSFSYLPIYFNKSWKLLSDVKILKLVYTDLNGKKLMATPIKELLESGRLEVVDAQVISGNDDVGVIIDEMKQSNLWLVVENDNLVGVVSPFDLL